MWPFSSKPKPVRSSIDDATVDSLLSASLKGRKNDNFRFIKTKGTMSVITMEDVEKASKKAYMPWLKDRWECEQQALAVVQDAQRLAANEGRSWAIGILRCLAPVGMDGLHVYVFAVIHTEGRFSGRDIAIYDPTARMWASAGNLHAVDFAFL